MSKFINNIQQITDNYDYFIIDLWGVIHDGTEIYENSIEALNYLKTRDKKILFLSNSPKRAIKSVESLENIGVNKDLYNHIITSGEFFFQNLNSFIPGVKVFHLGPEENRHIIDGSILIDSNIEECDFILSTGLLDYRKSITKEIEILNMAIKNNKKMLCINPDIIVITKDGQEHLCAGAIAEKYEKLGGQVLYIGKPHKEIYVEALKILDGKKDRTIAIGDSLRTDIKGSSDFGIDNVLITSGIHLNEQKASSIEDIFSKYNIYPEYHMKLFQSN